MIIETVDPGACSGRARGVDGVLVACAFVPSSIYWAGFGSHEQARQSDLLVVEVPDRVDPGVPLSAVLKCTLSAGRWIERLEPYAERVQTIKPSAWKGSVPKAVMLGRILSRLAPAERALLDALNLPESKRHNVIDAIGIFLWAAGRLGR